MKMQMDISDKTQREATQMIRYSDIEAEQYVDDAVSKYSQDLAHMRSGGGILSLPNPQFYNVTNDEARQAVKILEKAYKKLMDVNPAFDFGMNDIIAFAKQRLLLDSSTDKQTFCDNLYKDLENM